MAIPLSKLLTTPAGEEISSIELREPTIADIQKHGHPVVMGYDGQHVIIVPQPKAIIGYVSELSGYPPSTFKNLAIRDYLNLSAAVQDFFPTDDPVPNSS